MKYFVVKTTGSTKICHNNIVKVINDMGSKPFGKWDFADGSIRAKVSYYFKNYNNEVIEDTIHIHNSHGNGGRFVIDTDYVYFDENGKVSFDGRFWEENGWVEKPTNKMTLKEAYENRIIL